MILKKTVKVSTPKETPQETPKKKEVSSPPVSITEKDTMRGLFFIVKGQHHKGVEPSFVNKATGEVSYIGGYNPYDTNTEEWYMLLDSKTFYCIACGSNFKKVLRGVYTTIKRHKGVAKNYFRHISKVTSDDYYETHYLGHAPLTQKQAEKKADGRCPKVSAPMRCLYERVYSEYGDFFSEDVEEMEALAYLELVEEKPFNKNRKKLERTKSLKLNMEKKEVAEIPTPKKLVKPKVKIGMKKTPKV